MKNIVPALWWQLVSYVVENSDILVDFFINFAYVLFEGKFEV